MRVSEDTKAVYAMTSGTTVPINEITKRTRNTVQRRAVLQAVRTLGTVHPTASDIFAEVREYAPGLSLATVYRALDALVEQQEIGRGFVGNVARYDVSASPHHHIVCRHCGSVADMNIPLPAATVRRLQSAANGYTLNLESIQFTGACPVCIQAEK